MLFLKENFQKLVLKIQNRKDKTAEETSENRKLSFQISHTYYHRNKREKTKIAYTQKQRHQIL